MDLIRDVADWIASGWGDRLGIFFPLLLVGLLGLYLLWLVVGYLRVSQVGIADRATSQPVVALPSGAEDVPRGVPYCAHDQLQFPLGARFCTSCERDLSLDCTNCGATLSAGDASCYRCGTRTGVGDTALLS
jgi:Double zinc ribbon